MEFQLQINQRVAILIDGNNIERGIQSLTKKDEAMINFDRLVPEMLDGRQLNRFIYFREGTKFSQKFVKRIQDNFHGSVQLCHKSADVPLTIRACQLSSKVDVIIIFSGDADYVELVKHLKNEGVRVEVASVKRCLSTKLIEEADKHHILTEEDCWECKK